MWVVRALLIIFVVLCVVAFAYYNSGAEQKVDVHLIWVQYIQVPLITVVFWSFVAGVIVSLLVFISVYIKQSVQVRSARKRVRSLEGEVTVLRNRPIEESVDLIRGDSEKRAGSGSMFSESN